MKKTSFLTILCVLTTVNSAAIAATSLSSTSANSSAVGAVLRAGSLRNVPAKVNSNRETVSTNEKSDSERMSTLVGFSLGKYNTNTGTGSGNSGSAGNTNSAALNNLTNNVEKLTAEIGNLNLKVAGIEDSSVDIKIAADQAQTKAEDAKTRADVANTIATEARETAANAATAADTAQTAATNAKNIAETVSATFSPDAINGIKNDVQKASVVANEAKADVKNVHEELSAKMADKISKSEVVDVVRPVFYDKDETNILLKTKVGIDELNKKADADKVEYALQEINTNLSKKIDADKVPDMSNLYTKDKVYTKEEIAAFLANKADKGEGNGDIGGLENRIGALEIANFASKDYVDGKTDGKADKNGVYTKDEITAFLANKADKGAQNEDITNLVGRIGALESANFASKDYVDKQNNGKADKDGVYSKEEMNQRFKGYATIDSLSNFASKSDLANKADKSDLSGKLDSSTFDSYKQSNDNAMKDKADKSDLSGKLDSSTFDSYKQSNDNAMKDKADKSDLSGKLDSSTFDSYKQSNATAISNAQANAIAAANAATDNKLKDYPQSNDVYTKAEANSAISNATSNFYNKTETDSKYATATAFNTLNTTVTGTNGLQSQISSMNTALAGKADADSVTEALGAMTAKINNMITKYNQLSEVNEPIDALNGDFTLK